MFKHKLLRCSFCGKDEKQVAKLVAGPRVHICDACVTEAGRIIGGPDVQPPAPAAPRQSARRPFEWIGRWFGHRLQAGVVA